MDGKIVADNMRREMKCLLHVLSDFKPEHGEFVPEEGMMSVAQQIHHIAFTVKWFREGAFGAGFNMDFEALEAENRKELSLEDALAEVAREYDELAAFVEPMSEAELMQPLTPNPVFGEIPRVAVFSAQMDHTAHHRGSLAVYLRLLGITPKMPYTK